MSTKALLSPERRRLVEALQRLNFGHIERLHVRGGQPCFDPPPRFVREIKFGARNGRRPETSLDDFVLKHQAVELFFLLDDLGDGVVERLEVQHGLPFRMIIEPLQA